MVILLTLAVWYLGAMAVCAIGLWILCKIMDETNDKQTITDLTAKLTERDARIAALEKELADLKVRQYPSFITRSTFVQHSV